jgi:nicotinamidase-related amidase
MPADLTIDLPHTALLAMDCQSGIVATYAKPPEEFIARAASVLHAARASGMPVIHVRVGFRPGLPR